MAVEERLAATLQEAIKARQDARDLQSALMSGGPGGTSGGMTNDALKSRVDFLHTAFLWLAGALVTAVIGVIAIAVTMTNATNTRLDKASDSLSALNREVGQVSGKIDGTNQRLDRMDQKLDQISAGLSKR